MVAVKHNSKPVSTTTNKALYIDTRNAMELSKAVWNAKDSGTNPSIEWSIVAKTSPYQPRAKLCNLCLAEKLAILQSNPATTLNKRSEFNSKCCYKNMFKLKSFIA